MRSQVSLDIALQAPALRPLQPGDKQCRNIDDWPLQAVAELNRPDAKALTRKAVVFAYRLRGPVCGPSKLGGLDMVAAGGDHSQGGGEEGGRLHRYASFRTADAAEARSKTA
jgi:hypothetical protein